VGIVVGFDTIDPPKKGEANLNSKVQMDRFAGMALIYLCLLSSIVMENSHKFSLIFANKIANKIQFFNHFLTLFSSGQNDIKFDE
jgi:hypothetical protein